MNKLPKVAVIIANHNYGDYIVGAIESVLKQNYQGWLKIFIVDDNSNDDSINNVLEYIQKRGSITIDTNNGLGNGDLYKQFILGMIRDVYITLIGLKVNAKQGAARNIAIREAWDWADYFAILDSDDEMLPDKISKCIAKAMEFPDIIGSVHTDYYIENVETGAVTYEAKPPYSKELLMHGDCHLHSGGIISKKTLSKVGLFDEECPPKEDFHMWLKISDFFMCIHIPEPLVKVKITPKNSTVSHSEEYHLKQMRLMWDKYIIFRQQNGLPV